MSIHEEVARRLEPVLAVAAEHATSVDREGTFPSNTVAAARETGLLALVTPTEHGGLGGSPGDAARVVEQLARICASSAMVLGMHFCGASVLAKLGSAEVNREVAAGRHLSTLAFSEAGSRSHFWAPTSTARADGDEIVLDARKSWVTSASHATAFVWSSRPVSAEGASTLWLVERDRNGLSVPAPFDGLGLRGNDSSPVTATGVRIPASNRLGEDGGGFDGMMGIVLPTFQLTNAACSVGLMEAALVGAAAHVSGTSLEHLDQRLSALPTVRAHLARARVKADMARALWLDAIAAVDGGREDAMLRVLEVKVACGDAVLEVVATGMRVCGGAAYRREVGVERAFRDAQAASVMAPTSDVLYDFVGKALTGLPLFG
ncbi:MAG: acyl-CoA/acyl-ACP dehydrogenase [Alphaproteobacteria bacterium]|nr:acyl-CoA/acyl-ACP dehydrogenase [Alphaproteobacteria bacterium]MCB9696914.1 acyl-CoA/acyl-ACP dehydrogenase [Alphaproteobacteria bacterium]